MTRDPRSNLDTSLEAVNDRGQVIGDYEGHDSVMHSFLWDHGVFTFIDFPHGDGTMVSGLNDRGEVVGEYGVGNTRHGFLWHCGIFRRIDVPGSLDTSASGINDRGQIIGYYDRAEDDNEGYHGFLLSHGVYTLIDAPQERWKSFDQAEHLNARGQVVGSLDDEEGRDRGFLWDRGVLTVIAYPHAYTTTVRSINDRGQVFGEYHDAGGEHGFVWERGVYRRFDFPRPGVGTILMGLSDRGEAAGTYEHKDRKQTFPQTYGFVLRGGVYAPLKLPIGSGDSDFVWGGNNRGQVVGTYEDRHDNEHGFLLTRSDRRARRRRPRRVPSVPFEHSGTMASTRRTR